LTGHEIRRKFIEYFAAQGHRPVRSSSLVPHADPTLLFTNAGMNQFKDVFLGVETRDYRRAVTSQKCVRAGGKHNDLENVGFTNRHHTFFEMLGNFSFGDYFKKDAVAFAWDLVTSPQWYAIPKDRLYATVFNGEQGIPRDEEAEKHWLDVGVPRERVHAMGMKDNFWAMGDTGPCGPCSELHYDMGPAASDQGHTDCAFGCECGRYVEIWNLVFMQFNRDASGKLAPLPKPCVDTGMGLERITAVLQGKLSNFETDLFMPLIEFAGGLCGKDYGEARESDISLRILADHSRAAAFLISDSVLPANDGRGYVLRKILRRGIRHGRMLGLTRPFLFEMAGQVAELMKEPYPEVFDNIERVATVIKHEELRFSRTLDFGLRRLDEACTEAKGRDPRFEEFYLAHFSPAEEAKKAFAKLRPLTSRPDFADLDDSDVRRQVIALLRGAPATGMLIADARHNRATLDGAEAFRLYDTFGLPLDFIEDITRDQGITFDREGFERALNEQRERAKAAWKGVSKEAASPVYAKLAETYRTEPDFYYGTSTRDCRIEAILTKDGAVDGIPAGTEAEVVLDRTSFYAESGGQVADVGHLYDGDHTMQLAEVRGAYYPVTGLIAHRIVAKEKLCVGDRVATVADAARRERARRNHTGTHLMHAALRNILGTHVKQSGSLVAPDHLRFDFTHFAAVDPDELAEIEQQVNEHILRNVEMQTDLMNLDDALASGALAFFGDKYPDQNVRVVTIPDAHAPRGFFSRELCGGTHVRRTGDIGVFKIVGEQSVAAGVRRVEAITGERALADYQRALATLGRVGKTLNASEEEVVAAAERLAQTVKQLEKQIEALKRKAAYSLVDDLAGQARSVKDVRVLSANVPNVDRTALRQLADALRQKLGSGVVVLGTTEDGKVALITAVTKDLTPRLHAGKIVQALAQQVGGSGGGRPDLAEAGGKDTSALEKAIGQVYDIVAAML
jgi:alanyl-tRNA synthetase